MPVFQLLIYNFLFLINGRKFEIFWGVPSTLCRRFNVEFVNLEGKYGIVQNTNDSIRGDKITILYDPGNFPAILKDSFGRIFLRNGGLPQYGDLDLHLAEFEADLNQFIANKTYNGIAIIDFESWRPIFRQNYGELKPYKDYSLAYMKEKHPFWSSDKVLEQARMVFERASYSFVNRTLLRAQSLRHSAKWGYYAYPYCFNKIEKDVFFGFFPSTSILDNCPPEVETENDSLKFLFEDSDVIYPSVYITAQIKSGDISRFVKGKIHEAKRVASYSKNRTPKVIAFVRYQYTDTSNYLSKEDMTNILQTLKAEQSGGAILWGSSNQLKTESQCQTLKDYLESHLGPIARDVLMH